MQKAITYVGLDVHKDSIVVALAEIGLRGGVREYGRVPNAPSALKTLATRLAAKGNELDAQPLRLLLRKRLGKTALQIRRLSIV